MQRHYFLANEFEKNGNKTFIISNSNNHLIHKKNHKSKGHKLIDGIKFFWIKTVRHYPSSVMRFIPMFEFAFKIALLGFKRGNLPKPTIIILSSMSMFPLPAVLFLKTLFKSKKFIFEVRDLWPLTPIYLKNISPYNPLVLFMRFLEKQAYRKADAIVSLLSNAHDYVNPISKKPEKYHLIPNGIPYSFLEKQQEDNIEHEFSDTTLNLVYGGSMGLANALEPLVQCIEQKNNTSISNVHFYFIGDGYFKAAYIKRIGHLKNVTFIPKMSRYSFLNYLSKADISFIAANKSPLYQYGISPQKYYDYLSAALPVLAAHKGIQDDFISQSGCGIMIENKPQEIRKGLEKFIAMHPKERKKMGLNGKAYVAQFTYENLSKDYLSVVYS